MVSEQKNIWMHHYVTYNFHKSYCSWWIDRFYTLFFFFFYSLPLDVNEREHFSW